MTMTKTNNRVSPQQYLHRPIPVEAVQITKENISEAAKWCGGTVKGEIIRLKRVGVKTDDPFHYIMIGFYIVKNQNKYIPMSATQFEAKYFPGLNRLKE